MLIHLSASKLISCHMYYRIVMLSSTHSLLARSVLITDHLYHSTGKLRIMTALSIHMSFYPTRSLFTIMFYE